MSDGDSREKRRRGSRKRGRPDEIAAETPGMISANPHDALRTQDSDDLIGRVRGISLKDAVPAKKAGMRPVPAPPSAAAAASEPLVEPPAIKRPKKAESPGKKSPGDGRSF
ncbi:MAG: hypothetical protein RLN62_02325 [Rickettsiales bacterium]